MCVVTCVHAQQCVCVRVCVCAVNRYVCTYACAFYLVCDVTCHHRVSMATLQEHYSFIYHCLLEWLKEDD